jgi:nucleoside-diphosphate-sugar epimerase
MQKVLILGASGSFGSNCVTAFTTAGWEVRKFKRGQEGMATAAKGADVIVNGLNPQNYKDWVTELPKIAQQVVGAAKASGATIIQPGNVYNYGAQQGEWGADTPHRATTKKGRARIEMERILRESNVQVILLRAGDFLDTKNSGNFFDFLTSKLGKGQFIYPGQASIPHAWAFLPDMARAAVSLAEMRRQLGPFEDVPFAGLTARGEELRAALAKQTGRKVALKPFPWLFMKLASPFWLLAREMQEMRYLWDLPHSLSSARLHTLLPGFKASNLEDILRRVKPNG